MYSCTSFIFMAVEHSVCECPCIPHFPCGMTLGGSSCLSLVTILVWMNTCAYVSWYIWQELLMATVSGIWLLQIFNLRRWCPVICQSDCSNFYSHQKFVSSSEICLPSEIWVLINPHLQHLAFLNIFCQSSSCRKGTLWSQFGFLSYYWNRYLFR